ncbi:MAG: hypothetical protein ACTSVI_06820 [Promethearchaeota archaeon]
MLINKNCILTIIFIIIGLWQFPTGLLIDAGIVFMFFYMKRRKEHHQPNSEATGNVAKPDDDLMKLMMMTFLSEKMGIDKNKLMGNANVSAANNQGSRRKDYTRKTSATKRTSFKNNEIDLSFKKSFI